MCSFLETYCLKSNKKVKVDFTYSATFEVKKRKQRKTRNTWIDCERKGRGEEEGDREAEEDLN